MDIQELESPQVLKYEDFESLRCDKCKKYLNCPPIMVYLEHENLLHTACGRCYKADCETDGSSTTYVRNLSAETLAAVTQFPCKYYSGGCKERRTWPQIELHEKECMFREFGCALFNNNTLSSLTVMQVVNKYNEQYPNLILNDGIIRQAFDNDFEQTYLIQQNADLFICKVRYDVTTDKAWFTATLLEDRKDTECNIEFSDFSSRQSITVKFIPHSSEPTVVDFKGIKALLSSQTSVGRCKVYLNTQFFAHMSNDVLREIQCPACWDYMKGRIFMCSNGHNVCYDCKKSLQYCPTCREVEIQPTRNYSLERVIAQAFFPCRNHALGCSYVSTLDETICHYAICKFTFLKKDELDSLIITN